MNNDKAIVTLAIGKRYSDAWKECCQANWSRYANKNGYDLVCIDTPLDTSERARKRSPAWQKCLILSQPFATRYSRIVWVDADILINSALAPDICTQVPVDKVGAVEEMSLPTPELHREVLRRLNESRSWSGVAVEENSLGRQYYKNMGLPPDFDQVVQTGVLVLSPTHHRALLERVYYEYEDKGGREFHMEMPPLSYELLKADAVRWIDNRFNVNWIYEAMLHYPFLTNLDHEPGTVGRVKRRVGRWVLNLQGACMTTSFSLGYFLHVGGGDTYALMKWVNTLAESWLDCTL